ncbi:MAG: hypothetical protein KA792_09385 [Bacteroidales bacterium]|nr:hypothetical protein [Bacteroidales bacterium]
MKSIFNNAPSYFPNFTLIKTKLSLYFCVVFLFFINIKLNSQVNVRDSSINTFFISAHYAAMLPGGDMKDRFGWNNNLGGSFSFKSKHNLIAGLDFNFIFGNKIKEDTILDIIKNSKGYVIDGDGIYANINMFERGFYTAAKLGYIIPFFGPNPNSGIIISASAGFLQHKIRIEHTDNTAPQLRDDYLKGYDRLTNGLAISQFVGYAYFGNSRLMSFFAGIEFIEAWTESRRTYDFDRMGADKTKRFDLIKGVKVGWIFPLYRRASKSGYYYF